MLSSEKIFQFLKEQEPKTQKNISKLNAPKFIKPRSLRSKINYLKSFSLKISKEGDEVSYVYEDTHYYDTVRKVFLQFAEDKGLPKQAGFAIGTSKTKGVTNTIDVFIDDRKKVFKNIEKFIDTEYINEALRVLEETFSKNSKK